MRPQFALVGLVALLALLGGCAPVTGMAAPCETMACDYGCLQAGGTAGVCRADRCVCTGVDGGAEASTDSSEPDVLADVVNMLDVGGVLDAADAQGDASGPDAVIANDVASETTTPDATPTNDACAGTVCGGRCVDLQTDARNCGACGVRCDALRNVRPGAGACVAGVCRIDDACRVGYANCNFAEPGMGTSDGCESQVSLPTRCGNCSTMCSGETPMCTEVEIDPPSGDAGAVDASTGGDAGTPTTRYACTNGCSRMTPTRCNRDCVDLRSDPTNCGACGRRCAARCVAGVCGS